MKKRKSLVLLAAVVATLGLVTGCAGGNSSNKESNEKRTVQSVKEMLKYQQIQNE